MIKDNINYDLTVEILYSYIYEKGMNFTNIDKKFGMPNGTAKEIIDTCNVFKHCGLRFEQGTRSIPLKSIYKIARVNLEDITTILQNEKYGKLNYDIITKVIANEKYQRDIKNAFIKNALDARLEEIKDEKYKIKFKGLSNKINTALNFR